MNMRIVLAEDSESLGQIVKIKLQNAGYIVSWARDGETAWNMILLEQPALVILDIMMPKISGFEVLNSLKLHPETVQIPVMMMTARAVEEDVRRSIAGGATDYIVKPFKPDNLVQRVNRLLQVTQPQISKDDGSGRELARK